MKKILLAFALLIPAAGYADSSVELMQKMMDKKDRWERLDYAKIGFPQAGAECKADIGKQGVEINPAWKGGATQEVQDIQYKLSIAMAQAEHIKMFRACMEAKGWKFRSYTDAEYKELEKQELDKQNESR